MATFIWTPDFGMTKEQRPNVSVIRFGDGYEQRSAIGINFNLQTWSLTFNTRSIVEANAIDDFLNEAGGVASFKWTPPPGDSEELTVVCREWKKSFEKGQWYSVQCQFEEVQV